jgi:hypothetical protein
MTLYEFMRELETSPWFQERLQAGLLAVVHELVPAGALEAWHSRPVGVTEHRPRRIELRYGNYRLYTKTPELPMLMVPAEFNVDFLPLHRLKNEYARGFVMDIRAMAQLYAWQQGRLIGNPYCIHCAPETVDELLNEDASNDPLLAHTQCLAKVWRLAPAISEPSTEYSGVPF